MSGCDHHKCLRDGCKNCCYCGKDLIGVSNREVLPIEEWVDRHADKLHKDIVIHLQQLTEAKPSDIETAIRYIMISVRDLCEEHVTEKIQNERLEQQEKEISLLQKEKEIARQALKFYGNPKIYRGPNQKAEEGEETREGGYLLDVNWDGGVKANAALDILSRKETSSLLLADRVIELIKSLCKIYGVKLIRVAVDDGEGVSESKAIKKKVVKNV